MLRLDIKDEGALLKRAPARNACTFVTHRSSDGLTHASVGHLQRQLGTVLAQ